MTYCNAIAEGGEEEWQFGWSQYQASDVATEKDSLLNSLTCAKEVWLLNRYLNMSLYQESGVRNQDSYKVSHHEYSITLKYTDGTVLGYWRYWWRHCRKIPCLGFLSKQME